MDTIKEARRNQPVAPAFFGTAALTIAGAQLALNGFAEANQASRAGRRASIKPGTNTSFGSLKQIDAGLLASEPAKAPKNSAKKPRKAASGQKEMLMSIAGKKPAKESTSKRPSAKQQRKSA
jgi:hypothetical protein